MRRATFGIVLVFLLFGSLSLVPAQRTLSPRVHAIVGARAVLADRVLDKATVVVRDGLIEAVGADVEAPADALVLEGKGMTVYAGFIDALSNWGFDPAQKRGAVGDPAEEDLASEALAATKPDNRKGITPEFQVRAALRAEAEVADGWRRIGVTSHLVAPDGGILAGQSALVNLSEAPAREAVLASPVAQHLAFRSSGGTDYPRVLMGVIAHARQTLLDAGHHARMARAFEAAGRTGRRPPTDPALEALGPVLEGKMPVILEADTRDEIDRALDFAREFGMKPILFGGREAWKVVDRLAAEKVPVILRLDFTEESSPIVRAAERGMPERAREEARKRRQDEVACPRVLAEKGVLFAFSGQGLPDRASDRFRTNLLRAIDAGGLPHPAALAALTMNAARILGVESQVGALARGKVANLIVTDGDWHKSTTRVRHVFVDGLPVESEAGAGRASRPGGTEERPMGRGGRRRQQPPAAAEEKKTDAKQPQPKKADDPAPDTTPLPSDHACEIEADRKPATRTGGNVLLRGATVLPVTGDASVSDILVRGGKIAAVGKKLEVPEGVKVIDLTGYFIMPGIIDTHCHFAVSGGVNEFSLSVVPEVRIRDVIQGDDVQIYRAVAGGVTTARLLHGSANVVGGQDAVIKLKYGQPAKALVVADRKRGVKFALGENVKRTDGRFPNTRLGVEAVLVRAFSEARDYARKRQAWKKGEGPEPRRDLRLEALADVLSGDLEVHCHCYRADEILMLLRTAERFGVRVRSLQHVLEGYKVAPEIARHGASASPFSDWWAYKWEAADAIPHCAALLREAGVSVCLKSDSNELMRHMYQEAAKLVKYGGLSDREALATITLNGAKQLGLDRRVGSIEVGKEADLAVFNGHPLNGYSRVEMTLIEGEVYFEHKERKPSALAAQAPPKPTNRVPTLPAGKRVVIYNAVIHPVNGPVIEPGTIVIENGKIVEVRQSNGSESKSKGDEFDAAGMHIYPGMIDAGTVLGLIEVDSARETRDHAEGGDFQPDLRASTAINPDSELIPVTRANGVLSVVTRPTGGIIAGQSALVNLAGWVPEEMAVVDPLGLHVELPGGLPGIGRGTPFGMAGGAIARKTREAKLKRLRDLMRQALVHDKARKAKPQTPANPRLEALVPYARGEKPVIVQASRKEEILEALKLADELKLKVILAGGLDAWKVTGELKKRDVPVIVGPVLSLPYDRYDPYDAPYACPAKLHQAGVRFCIRSTGDNNTRNLPYHAAMAVSYGLPVEEGLKAVTLYPAQILGVADRLGSLEKGKQANLVLTNGDLLQAATQVVGLYVGGKPLSPTSKQTRLYERYRERLKEVKEVTR